MKKLFKSLLTLALSAPLLSGCSLPSFFSNLFSNLPEETKEVSGLDARSYTQSAELNSTYKFDGKVYVVYKDKTDKEVTEYCTFDPLDTTKVGSSMLKINYETKKVIYTHKVSISVYDPADKGDLESLRVTLNNDTVEKGKSYTFDGTVEAKYSKAGYVTVNNGDCSFSTINTSTVGDKTLTVTYQGKTATATVHVISKLVSISGQAVTVAQNKTSNIKLTFNPSDATYKEVSYVSNDTTVATVSDAGVVTGKKANSSTTITVTSKKYPEISTSIPVTVTETSNTDAWTVFIYLCGSNLESGWSEEYQQYLPDEYSYAATDDLNEIKQAGTIPDDVNIVVEAGGSSRWRSSYSSLVDTSHLSRMHLTKSGYVLDKKIDNDDMGDPDVLQSFLEWGIETYPAEKMALILWNHGGGLYGCCNDELSGGALLNNEVANAVGTAFENKGVDQFEWIGYDCCLMQTMEVAEFNSPYFKYMIASQESEFGDGWAYDEWVDNLYKGDSTETILTEIVDSFIESYGGVDAQGEDYEGDYYPADQTLSFLDLSKISAFKTAWESCASATSNMITSSNKDEFKNNIIKKIQTFGGDDWDYFAEFDAMHYLQKLENDEDFNPGGNYVSNAKNALSELISYNLVQKEHSANANGLSFYFGPTYSKSTYSHFTNWNSLISKVGGITYSY